MPPPRARPVPTRPVRRHMSSLNDHNYAEPLTKEKAVFAFNSMSHGPMAQFLEKQAASPPKSPNQMAPRGRTRAADEYATPPPPEL